MPLRRGLPGIDVLRVGACLLIAAHHAKSAGLSERFLPVLGYVSGPLALGPCLTSLFLILSGFVLFYASVDLDGNMTRSPRAFWRARAVRLVPLMLLGHVLVAPLALTGASRYEPGEALVRAGLAVTATQAWFPRLAGSYNTPAWSLSALALGYLLFPWLTRLVVTTSVRRTALLLLASWCAGPLFADWLLGHPDIALLNWFAGSPAGLLHTFPPVRVLEFVSGILLGRMWLAPADARAPWVAALLAPGIALAALAVSPLLWSLPERVLATGGLAPLWWLCLWSAARFRTASGFVLHASHNLGRASLSVFVLHGALLSWLNVALSRGWLGSMNGVALAAWFLALVPLGLVAERRFVTPVARWLMRPRRESTGAVAGEHAGISSARAPEPRRVSSEHTRLG
jgi:peptidoglycan/LPS O-acetylase OafA/YrhL